MNDRRLMPSVSNRLCFGFVIVGLMMAVFSSPSAWAQKIDWQKVLVRLVFLGLVFLGAVPAQMPAAQSARQQG